MMNDELVSMIEAFESKKNKGLMVNGGDVTQLYNRVLDRNVPSTNCGSCLRRRIEELVQVKDKYIADKKASEEALKQAKKKTKKEDE